MKDEENIFLLANLMYFKGGWTWPFDKSKTVDDTFYNVDGTTSKVKMMSTELRQFERISADAYVALRLPYGNEAFSMIVVWPREDIQKAMTAIFDDPSKLTMLAAGKSHVDEHMLRMPKFDFKFTSLLNLIYLELGIKDIFNRDIIDFSGIMDMDAFLSRWDQLWIGTTIQTCRIAVDEYKTEAGEGSYVVAHSGPNPDPLVITLDHPFLFFISERSTGLPIFMGSINQF